MPFPIRHKQIKRAVDILLPQRTHMRRDDHILRIPQRIVFRQGFRVRHIQRRPAENLIIQRRDQGLLIQNRATGDVDQERFRSSSSFGLGRAASTPEQSKFLGSKQAPCRRRERQSDDKRVQARREKRVQRCLGGATVPCHREAAVRIAGARDEVAIVTAGGRTCAWGGGVSVDVCA